MAFDFEDSLSLETKDEWPQKGDEYWTPGTSQSLMWRLKNPDEIDGYLANGIIFRTEEESERYRRQRIARTAIHRWIAEKAEKVDWNNIGQAKAFPFWCPRENKWVRDETTATMIPGWFFVDRDDYDRMMSENAAHFDVLKEGE